MWQFFWRDRLEGAVMLAFSAIITGVMTGGLTMATIVTSLVLIATFSVFTLIRYRQYESVQLYDLARKLKVISDNARPLVEGTSDIGIRNIALDLLKSKEVVATLGKGADGWKTFFDLYGGMASEGFNHFVYTLDGFVRQRRDGGALSDIVRGFKLALLNHYTVLDNFYKMLTSIGMDKVSLDTKKRYRSFGQEYDSFVQGL